MVECLTYHGFRVTHWDETRMYLLETKNAGSWQILRLEDNQDAAVDAFKRYVKHRQASTAQAVWT